MSHVLTPSASPLSCLHFPYSILPHIFLLLSGHSVHAGVGTETRVVNVTTGKRFGLCGICYGKP